MKNLFLLLAFFTIFLSPAARAQQDMPIPDMPEPIKELVNQGAQARYMGRDFGLDAWITIKNGQEQYFYVMPDQQAFLMGVLFNNKGKLVTIDQVRRLREQGDTLLDSIDDGFTDATPKTDQKISPEFSAPSDRLFYDVQNSNWIPLGQLGAPVAYAFVDPQCPHCHDFLNDLRKDYIDKGLVQLRIIPVGFKEESIAQAAYLLAAPSPQERWWKHMDGDKEALPAKAEINQQGVQRNLAIMQSWKFDVTPLIVYRDKQEKIKIVKGRPKDIPALVSDLGARS
ncbi:MAG: thioredoxin fold domain-containing protein [Alphaproteobacteria bacterium]|nr:thioredoxin fold domain-containing protein [Alphaproteobacteria bacterium]